MADDITGDGSGVDASVAGTGASDGASPAGADQGGADSGAQVSAEELAKLHKRLDDTRSQYDKKLSELTSMNEKLVEALTTSRGVDTQREQEAVQKARADLQKRFDDGELTGEQFLGLLDGIAEDAETRLSSKYDEKLTALEKREQELQALIDQRTAELDPAYVSRKEQVDKIQQELGVDRAVAMKIAAKYEQPAQPARPAIPGATGTGVVATQAESPVMDSGDFAELSKIIGVEITPEAQKELNQKWSKK